MFDNHVVCENLCQNVHNIKEKKFKVKKKYIYHVNKIKLMRNKNLKHIKIQYN